MISIFFNLCVIVRRQNDFRTGAEFQVEFYFAKHSTVTTAFGFSHHPTHPHVLPLETIAHFC